MPRITDALIKTLSTPSAGRPLVVRDNLINGFGVRKTATGCTAFILNYVVNGRERRMTIGRYPAWSVSAARAEAARIRRQTDGGADPLEEIKAARSVLTLEKLWENYCAEVLVGKAPSTQSDERSIWQRLVLPKLGNRRICDIRASDVDALHRAVSLNTPVQANRLVASLRHVFTKAKRWGLIAENPAAGVAKNREQPRHRYLSEAERQQFIRALDGRPDTSSGLALRFLILTGARRGEVLNARWEQFDTVQRIWIKPSALTKQRTMHRVPLSAGAIDILDRARALHNSEFVFAGRGGRALVEIKKLFKAVCAEANITGFRIHDLRHSYASLLVASGVSLPIIGSLLGHTQVSTTARYTHLYDTPMRDATNIVSEAIYR